MNSRGHINHFSAHYRPASRAATFTPTASYSWKWVSSLSSIKCDWLPMHGTPKHFFKPWQSRVLGPLGLRKRYALKSPTRPLLTHLIPTQQNEIPILLHSVYVPNMHPNDKQNIKYPNGTFSMQQQIQRQWRTNPPNRNYFFLNLSRLRSPRPHLRIPTVSK